MNGISVYYFGAIALILIGLYAILTKRNLIKILIGISIMNAGINLLLVSIGNVRKFTAPILTGKANPSNTVDPIPQALVLTAIVIGVATLALGLSIVINIYENHGSLDVNKLKEMKK